MFDAPATFDVARKAAGTDTTLLSDDELLAMAEGVSGAMSVLAGARAHAVAELDARGVTDRDVGLRTATWLGRTAGMPSGAARSQVRVANALRRRFSAVDEALCEGRISWDHARAITGVANDRIAEQVASVQGHLIDSVAGSTFDAWARNLRGLANLIDHDGGHDPDRDTASSSLRFTRDYNGNLRLDAVLAGTLGEAAKAALEGRADELFTRFNNDHKACPDIDIPPRHELLALALGDLLRLGLATDPATSRPPRPEITLTAQATDPSASSTCDGTALTDSMGRCFACDAHWYPVILDSLGVPLDAGRAIRHATRAQRRATATRDGGCVFPGCDCPSTWLDLHHIEPWHAGGPTDIGNLAGLCRHHHGVTHRNGWAMHTTPDGWFWWQTPTGHTMWSQRHGTQRAGPAPPAV